MIGHVDGAFLRVDGRSSLLGVSGVGMDVGVLARVEAEDVVVDAAELPQEEEEEERAREDIEDAVPDHLRARADHVRALGECPTDRVRDEHEGEVGGREDVALAEDTACCERVARGLPEQDPPKRQSTCQRKIRIDV